ncbi:MAG: hypothetical protein MUF85_02155 [Patescibacteria group bacterium]|jgi:hypothetical protein|nr:hypothetical protein [Patescibacteria group bacterium]
MQQNNISNQEPPVSPNPITEPLAPQKKVIVSDVEQLNQIKSSTITPKSSKKIKSAVGIMSVILVGSLIVIVPIALIAIKILVWDKSAIDGEMYNTATPKSCTEFSKTYGQGDFIDSVPTWFIYYNCTDSPATIYKSVKNSAEQNGYKINWDDVNIIRGKFYSANLCLIRSGYITKWFIGYGYDDDGRTSDKPKVEVTINRISCT